MKRFLLTIIYYILTVCIIVLLVNEVYVYQERKNDFGTMQNSKNDSATIKEVPNEIEICNLGSSHGYYGFNYEDIKDEFTCFNFALPAQTLSYDFRILENYQENINEGATVFIVVSYLSFFGKPEIDDAQFDAKNKRYYKFLSNDFIKKYDRKTDLLVNYAPSLLESDMVGLIKTLFGVRQRNIWDMTTNEEIVEYQAYDRYIAHIKSRLDDKGMRIYNKEEITALYSIIDVCQKKRIDPILITPPYLSEYTEVIQKNDQTFYSDFHNLMDKVVRDTGVVYYDYSSEPGFANDYSLFINVDHLNRQGAKKFTTVLWNEERKKAN